MMKIATVVKAGRQFGRLSPNIWGRRRNRQLPPILAINCIISYVGMNRMRQCPWTGRKSAPFGAMIREKNGHFYIWRPAGFAICNAPMQTPIIRRWRGICWHGSYLAHQGNSGHQSNLGLKSGRSSNPAYGTAVALPQAVNLVRARSA